jgi:putative membrane protein
MPPAIQTALESWEFPFGLTFAIVAAALVYLRGWLRVRPAQPDVIPAGRAAAFFAGLLLVWLAIGSPLAAFDEQLLTVHMAQHLLLMTLAPPLILLGAPMIALLNGLPRDFVQGYIGPLFRWTPVHKLGRTLVQPQFGWFAGAAALVGWHFPAAFTLALKSEAWHVVEHASFFTAGILFWWPVVQPTAPARPRWSIILYLFLATLPCDVLSAFLVFGERVAYPIYSSVPRLFGIPVLEDQQFAGALMWTCVTILYLVPATILTVSLLTTRGSDADGLEHSKVQAITDGQSGPSGVEAK